MTRYASVTQRNPGHWRTLTVMLVLCVALTFRWPSQQACAGEPAPTTTRAVAGAKDAPSLALLDVLSKVKWPKKSDWEDVLARIEQKSLIGFNLGERDRLLATLAKSIEAGPQSKARCLILECIMESGGAWPRYERLILYSPDGINRQVLDDLKRHRALELKEDVWTKMEGWITTSVKTGGSDHGIGPVMDWRDTTVISYYNGARWQVAVWMYSEIYATNLLTLRFQPSGAVTFDKPSAEILAFGKLICFLDTLPGVPARFAPDRYGEIKDLIQYPPKDRPAPGK